MRDEIRKHQKGSESREGDGCGCGRQTSTLGEAVSRKRLFFPIFFFLFPLVCVTSRAALTLWKQGRVSLQGSLWTPSPLRTVRGTRSPQASRDATRDSARPASRCGKSRVQRAQCRGRSAVRSDWDTTTALLCRSPGSKSHWHLD